MSNSQDRAAGNDIVLARLGALCYVLWGLLHYSAAYGLFQLADTVPASVVRARLQQDGFYLAGLATIGIIVGVWLNWRNDRVGFWMNAVAVSLGDIPFVVLVLLPGYMPFWPGVLGPALWVAGLSFTALGRALGPVVGPETGFSHRSSHAM